MAGIGHNSGRGNPTGSGWRTYAWRQARRALLPKLPVEVLRLRVKRAKALGLPYRTYAGVRASTGHDLIGFLFSSNALGVWKDGQIIPQNVASKLVSLADCDRVGLRQAAALAGPLEAIDAAPDPQDAWPLVRDRIKAITRARGHAADRYLVIGDTALEREWSCAGQTAGYLPAAQYFDDAVLQTV